MSNLQTKDIFINNKSFKVEWDKCIKKVLGDDNKEYITKQHAKYPEILALYRGRENDPSFDNWKEAIKAAGYKGVVKRNTDEYNIVLDHYKRIMKEKEEQIKIAKDIKENGYHIKEIIV